MRSLGIILTAILVLVSFGANGQSGSPEKALLKGNKLEEDFTFLWTSSNENVLNDYISSYSKKLNQNPKWEDVTLILWGPAVKTLSQDKALLAELASLHQRGIEVKVSKTSAKKYEVAKELNDIGVRLGNARKELTADLRGDASHVVDL